MANLQSELAWIQSAMRFQAAFCSSFQIPGQPGVIRPSGVMQVISAMTMAAPPRARLPRCTRWKSPGTPSTHEYCAMGETMTRFFSVRPRTVRGVNMGGGGVAASATGRPSRRANQRS